jgi:lysozyme
MVEIVRGVDVAEFQKVVDWKTLYEQEACRFAIIRCKVGNNPGIDKLFHQNVAGAREAGMRVGAYHFSFPLPKLDPRREAESFAAASMLGSEAGDIPPAFDLEWPPPVAGGGKKGWKEWGCSAAQVRDHALIALERMTELFGCKPLFYTYPYFWQAMSVAGGMEDFRQYPLWIPGGKHYVNGDGHIPDYSKEKAPQIPLWGDDWSIHQFDGDGGRKMPNGVDCDFNAFRGTEEDFANFCDVTRKGTPEQPPVFDQTVPLDVAQVGARNLLIEDLMQEGRQERWARMVM